MADRREFLAKIAAGVGLLPALQKLQPKEIHELETDSVYALVIPGIGPDHAEELQEWYNEKCAQLGIRFVVFTSRDIEFYKLQ